MQERLQKIISAAGIASRRAAEALILEGRVRVNGKVVTELGSKADPDKDHIKVDGKLINPRQTKTYILLNKPAGYVTTLSDPERRQTVQDLLKGVKARVYPVGRLDYNTEGLLLLTNDGDFAHRIMHPSHELPKTYLVKIKGVLSDDAVSRLEAGVFLKDGKTAPARVKRLRKEEANSWVEITIHEGKKRQVRRMIDHVGNSVIRLKRVKVGNLPLGNLPPGSYRYLTPDEVKMLKDMAEGKIRETKDERAARAPAVAVKKPGRIKRREDLGELSRAAAGGRATIFAAREKHYTERRKATRERGTVRGARDEDKTRRREDASRGRKERRAWGEDKTGRRKPGEFSRAASGERGKERRTGVSRKKPRAGSQRSNERNMKPAGKPRRPLR